jgi:hypothetical protein
MKVWEQTQENAVRRSNLYSCIDFAASGQDAIAMVFSFCALYPEYALKPVILELAALPQPTYTLLLADAAAIKVRPFYPQSIKIPSTWLVGGHNLACKVSEAVISV